MSHRRIRPGAQLPVAAKRTGLLQQSGTVLPLPVVITLPANGLTNTGADLNGSVNPEGSATSTWFAYGTTPQYGSVTSTISLGSGTVPKVVGAVLTGLTQGVTYHFAVVAQSAAGTVFGQDQAFVAQTPVPTPVIITAPPTDTAIQIPHENFPYTFSPTTGVAMVEQDSLDEIFACVQAIVACPVGARNDLPAFGVQSQLFGQAPLDATGVERAIVRWEPRAATAAVEYPDMVSDAIRHLQIAVSAAQAN